MTFIEAVRQLELKHPMTDRPVTPRELIDILKEDVVYAVPRPGSWEGSNMLTVLVCHGFFTHHRQEGYCPTSWAKSATSWVQVGSLNPIYPFAIKRKTELVGVGGPNTRRGERGVS